MALFLRFLVMVSRGISLDAGSSTKSTINKHPSKTYYDTSYSMK
jgi:hypothetical protein